MIEPEVELDVKRDLDYINNELISITHENTYVKFSRPLNAVSVVGGPKSQFERYWFSKYTKKPNEQKQIMNALDELFNSKLTPPEDMIKMIEKSNDSENEKSRAIFLLRPKPVKTKENPENRKLEEKTEGHIWLLRPF